MFNFISENKNYVDKIKLQKPKTKCYNVTNKKFFIMQKYFVTYLET